MNRRRFLTATGTAAGLATAGCLEVFETATEETGRLPPLVEDRPDAVYLPASVEEMGTYGTKQLADGAECSLHFTLPHRFWTVTGSNSKSYPVPT